MKRSLSEPVMPKRFQNFVILIGSNILNSNFIKTKQILILVIFAKTF